MPGRNKVSDTMRSAQKAAAALSRSKAGECVRVIVRVRPMSRKETQDGRDVCAIVDEKAGTVAARNPHADRSEPPKQFTFDNTYGPKSQQREIYDRTAASIVESVCEGYNGTIFAYGQTGSGKTHTMEGYPDPPELRGIIPNSFKHIFEKIGVDDAPDDKQFLVRASYLEIYNEEIRDLLAKNPKNRLDLKENMDSGVYVKDLTSFVVKSVSEIDHVMQAGKKNRSVGSTLMNQTSSRSHSIFTIVFETSETGPDGETHIRVGKLNLVDLAGSERQSKTGATGDRLKEATKINLSLSALGNVISALINPKAQHVPYRDSKLTRLLQDSLGGNTKTVMIACCGPADYNYEETLSTLRYANRAKSIKNKPKINEDPKDAMLREFQDEIERLKQKLKEAEMGVTIVDGKEVPIGAMKERVVEKIVEKVVHKGPSEEEMKELERRANHEKEEIRRKAQEELRQMKLAQSKSEIDRKNLEEKLKRESDQAAQASKAKKALQKKLKAMEEKLLIGGQLMSKAAKQEAELRRAQLELDERRRQEQTLAMELAEKEEANMLMEEQYTSMQDEVEVKTRKLKKLWSKYQAQKTEVKDLQNEFQQEREDMLDTIRELTRQLKLKQVITEHFIPPEEVEKLNARAQWSDENDTWSIRRLEFSGNAVRGVHKITAQGLRRPETDFARQRKGYDSNARYKSDNMENLELDMPERTTQDYEGAAMSQRVQAALDAALMGEDDEIEFQAPENLPDCNPYLNYNPDDGAGRNQYDGSRKRKEGRKSKKKRPTTANRRGRGERRHKEDVMDPRSLMGRYDDDVEEYPSARGLVGRR